MVKNNSKVLDGSKAFKLYDTYGFPLDLTKEILDEKNLSVDIDSFNECMNEQRELARNSRKKDAGWSLDNINVEGIEKTEFNGYESYTTTSKIIRIFQNDKEVESIKNGNKGIIVTDKTSFYAEGGGEVADTGSISSDKFEAKVIDVQKKNDIYFHYIDNIDANLEIGDKVKLEVDSKIRKDIEKNHSATHLLDQALRDVLGDDIKQAGSLVDKEKLRFDFTYDKPISKEQILKIEKLVNNQIQNMLPVKKEIVDYKKSQEMGAIGLFEDKYKEKVRVVSMGDYSKELCGGCHVNNTSEILIFKILSESSVAAGVRRIEAITGRKVYEYLLQKEEILDVISNKLKTNAKQLPSKIDSLYQNISEKDKEIARLKTISTKDIETQLENEIINKNGLNILIKKFNDFSLDQVKDLENNLKNKYDNLILVFAIVTDKIVFVVSVDDNLTDKYDAGKIVREIAKMAGGNGGGKKNFAQAGGKDINKVDDALQKALEII